MLVFFYKFCAKIQQKNDLCKFFHHFSCVYQKKAVDGSVSDISVSRSAGDPVLNNEAVRIIEQMLRWNPGKHNGEPVRVYARATR